MSSEKIQVLCRVRPGSDKDRHEDDVLAWCDATNRVAPLLGADGAGSTRSFEFQNVLGPDQGNTEAFAAVRDVVDSALDGMNATVMAYGHTSSGKTHTMLGTPAEPGIIIRTVQHLLGGFAARGAALDSADAAEAGDVDMEAPSTPTTPTTPSGRAPPTPSKRKGEQAAPRAPKRGGGGAPRITASYFEVYMERVYDLLSADRREVEVVSGGDDAGAASGPVVQNLERRDLRALSDCVAMVSAGQETRRVARTNLNENSSRGHTVFQLELHLPQSRYAQVRLVDLAGSENAKAAGGGGLTAREGGAINKSLLALTNVIQSLAAAERPRGAGSSAATSSPYIPYRDAKLTRILQNSLGGNSKTRIICCVASKRAQFDETLATLLFSDRARTVKNTVRVNTVPPSVLAAAASSAPAAATASGENSPGSVAQFSSQAVKQSLAEAAGLAEEYKRAADEIAEAARSLVASDAGVGAAGDADEVARRDEALVRDAVVPMMAHLLSEMKGEADLWRETEYLLQKKCYALTENFQKKLARHADQREAEVAKERERGREKLEAERARHAEEVARLTAAAAAATAAAGGNGGDNAAAAAAAAAAEASASASAAAAAELEQCRRQLRDAAAREDEARSRLAEAEAEVLRERSARAAAEAAVSEACPPPAVVGVQSVSFESLYMKAKAEVKELKVKLTQVLTVQRTCTERMVEAKVVQISTRKSLKRSYSALQTEQSESCVVRSDQQTDVSMLDASAEAEHSSMAIDGSSSMFAGGPPPAMPAGIEGASFVTGGGGGGGGGAPPLAVRGKKSRTPQHPARRMVPESTPPRSAATRTRTPGRAAPATPVSSRTPAGAATPKSTARSRTPTGGMRTPKATPASGTRTRTAHASPAQPVRPVNLFGASSKRTGSAPVPKRRKMKTPTPTAPARREETAWM